jgi:hypothetical protein
MMTAGRFCKNVPGICCVARKCHFECPPVKAYQAQPSWRYTFALGFSEKEFPWETSERLTNTYTTLNVLNAFVLTFEVLVAIAMLACNTLSAAQSDFPSTFKFSTEIYFRFGNSKEETRPNKLERAPHICEHA